MYLPPHSQWMAKSRTKPLLASSKSKAFPLCKIAPIHIGANLQGFSFNLPLQCKNVLHCSQERERESPHALHNYVLGWEFTTSSGTHSDRFQVLGQTLSLNSALWSREVHVISFFLRKNNLILVHLFILAFLNLTSQILISTFCQRAPGHWGRQKSQSAITVQCPNYVILFIPSLSMARTYVQHYMACQSLPMDAFWGLSCSISNHKAPQGCTAQRRDSTGLSGVCTERPISLHHNSLLSGVCFQIFHSSELWALEVS